MTLTEVDANRTLPSAGNSRASYSDQCATQKAIPVSLLLVGKENSAHDAQTSKSAFTSTIQTSTPTIHSSHTSPVASSANQTLPQHTPCTIVIEDDASPTQPDSHFVPRYNCNQIRSKINTFINNGDMTSNEFRSQLQVSPGYTSPSCTRTAHTPA